MAIHQIASLALKRLLLRAYRHMSVAPDAYYVLLVQCQPSLRTTGSVKAEHMAPPRRHQVTTMVKMITSSKMRLNWWLALTRLISMRSTSIMPVSFWHGRAFKIMRGKISPSNMTAPTRQCGHVDCSIGALPR